MRKNYYFYTLRNKYTFCVLVLSLRQKSPQFFYILYSIFYIKLPNKSVSSIRFSKKEISDRESTRKKTGDRRGIDEGEGKEAANECKQGVDGNFTVTSLTHSQKALANERFARSEHRSVTKSPFVGGQSVRTLSWHGEISAPRAN